MSDESSPIIKRAAVTYGRRRVPTSDEVEASPAADTSITSIHSLFAASSESGIDLPPDSDDFDASFRSFVGEEDDESEGLADLSFNIPRRNRGGEDRGYEFDWKRKLREMDSDGEDGIAEGVTHEGTHAHKGEVLKDQKQEDMATISREVIDDEPFSSSLPVLTSSSARSSPASSPPPSLNVHRRVKKRAVVQQSDSESEAPPPKSPASTLR